MLFTKSRHRTPQDTEELLLEKAKPHIISLALALGFETSPVNTDFLIDEGFQISFGYENPTNEPTLVCWVILSSENFLLEADIVEGPRSEEFTREVELFFEQMLN